MRVDQIFKNTASGRRPVSFEMFPPKGELTLDRARDVAGKMAELEPDFMSVTYSAGGSGNQGATAAIAQMIHDELGVSSVAHLTCISLMRYEFEAKIVEFRAHGVENVLALRGDVPANDTADPSHPADFRYAKDIIPALVDAGFCVGAAAYPEGHIECDDLKLSVEHLRQKQDAGASFFVTQLFFDNTAFYRFREMCDHAGITVPITAGIMPFMSKSQVERMIFMCGASLPSPVIKLLARWEDDPDALRQAGIEYACAQLEDLQANGAAGVHVYTMNRPSVARAAMRALRG